MTTSDDPRDDPFGQDQWWESLMRQGGYATNPNPPSADAAAGPTTEPETLPLFASEPTTARSTNPNIIKGEIVPQPGDDAEPPVPGAQPQREADIIAAAALLAAAAEANQPAPPEPEAELIDDLMTADLGDSAEDAGGVGGPKGGHYRGPWWLIPIVVGALVFGGAFAWTHRATETAPSYPVAPVGSTADMAVCVSDTYKAVIWASPDGTYFQTTMPGESGTTWTAPDGVQVTLTAAAAADLPKCGEGL